MVEGLRTLNNSLRNPWHSELIKNALSQVSAGVRNRTVGLAVGLLVFSLGLLQRMHRVRGSLYSLVRLDKRFLDSTKHGIMVTITTVLSRLEDISIHDQGHLISASISGKDLHLACEEVCNQPIDVVFSSNLFGLAPY